MLQSIHVKNIALIDEVEIDLTDGLNILTGETGAGKSIIIDSVNFALGSRMPKDVVRDDSDYALCELVFSVEDEKTLSELRSHDIMLTDDQVILQRKIVNGKSSCKVNGETVPASVIRQIAEHLIDIHGQHEHQSLLYRKNHKIILDSFCRDGFNNELCKLSSAYDSYKKILREYEQALSSKDSAAADLDFSRFVVNEIESAGIREGEDEELEDDFKRMNNSMKIMELVSGAQLALSSDGESASSMIGHALSLLRQVNDIDEGAGSVYEQLVSAEDVLGDAVRELGAYAEKLEYSPEDYERVKERLDVINSLKMKYGHSISQINERLAEEFAKVEKLSDYETYLADLEDKKTKEYEELLKLCKKVSDMRKSEAATLEGEIAGALSALNFLDARFEIAITSDPEKIGADGYDEVEFLVSTNPGEELKPLTNVASGGELSRIMLAIKSVVAKRDNIGTLIFDEIDTGISGKTAQLVADRMADIAKAHQVIAVTHLPQIASHATTHFLIEKKAEGTHTSTGVHKLSYDDSIEELARMLAGESINDTARENARALKAGSG
ncbi:MAG: DNA repair protein RecN [Lachnospiraceae bacterium]|nr:DNA repair protein RecN [Lachnospiraceae bacterium]